MSDQGFIESSKEASRGGYQGIKKIRGLLQPLKKVPPKFTDTKFGEPKEQIEVVLEDAAILEMLPNEEEPELKDNKFTFWVPYAEPGKTPNANSIYIKVWVASAEALGKKPSDFVNEYVTLERKDVELFKTDKDDTGKPLGKDENDEKIYRHVTTDRYFTFVADEKEDSPDLIAYIKGKVIDKNRTAVIRFLAMDDRVKQYPSYKEALSAGTFEELIGVKLNDDGVFEDAEGVGADEVKDSE